jgi:hypothetical protein
VKPPKNDPLLEDKSFPFVIICVHPWLIIVTFRRQELPGFGAFIAAPEPKRGIKHFDFAAKHFDFETKCFCFAPTQRAFGATQSDSVTTQRAFGTKQSDFATTQSDSGKTRRAFGTNQSVLGKTL